MYKLAVTGPESTGKSEMSAFLSAHLKSPLIPEFARIYLEASGPKYTYEDVEKIAYMQHQMEEMAFGGNHSYVVCDTDMLVLQIWMEVVFGKCPEWIEHLAGDKQRYSFTFLMDIDLPWEDDILREHPTRRLEIMQLYTSKLEASGRVYGIVNGIGKERQGKALNLLNSLP
jgi:nicotinamide riboside kinase